MRHILITALVVLTMSVSAFAQDADVSRIREAAKSNALGIEPASTPFSLLDLSRLQWSHSYSLSFVSGGGYSGSVGLLNTQMFYEFSPKLSLTVDIGVLHNTGTIWGDSNNDATILPGFRLDYHPSEKFSMSIGVTRYNGVAAPSGYYPGYGFSSLRSPYGF